MTQSMHLGFGYLSSSPALLSTGCVALNKLLNLSVVVCNLGMLIPNLKGCWTGLNVISESGLL